VKRWFVDVPASSVTDWVVLASDYDAEVAAHEMTAHELMCAEGERDEWKANSDLHTPYWEEERRRRIKAEAGRDDCRARYEGLRELANRYVVESHDHLARAEKAEAERDIARQDAAQQRGRAVAAKGERDEWADRARVAEKDCYSLQAERDKLAAKVSDLEWKLAHGSVCELAGSGNDNVRSYMDHWEQRAVKAEAKVERVRGLAQSLRDSGTHANEACNIENALADDPPPVQPSYCRVCQRSINVVNLYHGWGKCKERRQGDRRGMYSTPSTGRRKAERRGGGR
jgi:hypothetical protein